MRFAASAMAVGTFKIRALAFAPLLELVMRLSQVVQDLAVVFSLGGSFLEQIQRARVQLAAIAQDAE